MSGKEVTQVGKRGKRKKNRVDQVADQILDKIEQAVEELTVQPVTQVRKEKDVFYENQDNPGKVTREVIQETQTVSLVDVPVDRNGIKQLVSALKEVQSLSQEESEEAKALEVVLEGALKAYAE